MKKLSLYVFLGLLWCNVGFAIENNKYDALYDRAEKAKGKEVLLIVMELHYGMIELIELMQKCADEYDLYNNTDGKFCKTYMSNRTNEKKLLKVGVAVGAEVTKIVGLYADNSNPPEWVKAFAESYNRNLNLLDKWEVLNDKLKKAHGYY